MSYSKGKMYLILGSRWGSSQRVSSEEMFTKFRRGGIDPMNDTVVHISQAAADYDCMLNDRVRQIGLKHNARLRFWYDLTSVVWLPYFLRKNNIKPDIIIVAEPLLTLAGLLPKLLWKTKVVFSLTNLPRNLANTRKFSLLRRMYFWVSERIAVIISDLVLVINQATYSYILETGIDPKKIYLQNSNVIERDRQYIDAVQPGSVRTRLGVLEGQKIILSVGRLEAEKDYPRLLRYVSALPSDYTLVICGSGVLEGELVTLAAELEIADRVVFAGYVSRSEIWNYYRDADAFVLLSRSEALGLVVWEAMYMRCPVLVSEADGLVECVGVNGNRGFIIKEKAPAEVFVDYVEQAVDDTQEVKVMVERAYQYVEEKSRDVIKMNDILSTINK